MNTKLLSLTLLAMSGAAYAGTYGECWYDVGSITCVQSSGGLAEASDGAQRTFDGWCYVRGAHHVDQQVTWTGVAASCSASTGRSVLLPKCLSIAQAAGCTHNCGGPGGPDPLPEEP